MRKLSKQEIEDHGQYDLVYRMVLWGEEEEDIRTRLRANDVERDMADQFIAHANKLRIQIIRSGCLKNVLIGIGAFILGLILFIALGPHIGLGSRKLPFISWLGMAYGVWKIVESATTYLMAPSKSGPIDD